MHVRKKAIVKKALFVFILFLVFQTNFFSLDQSFPNGITFSSQDDIDSYKEVNYDGIEIFEDVIIEGNDIVFNLYGVGGLTQVGSQLIMYQLGWNRMDFFLK